MQKKLISIKGASKLKYVFLFLFFHICLSAIAQKGKYNNNIINPKNVNIYQSITEANREKILVTKGWLDTTKPVIIQYGSGEYTNTGIVTYRELKEGYWTEFNRLVGVIVDGKLIDEPIKIKLEKGNLVIDANVLGFDGNYIVKVRHNKLYPVAGRVFEPYYSHDFFEVMEAQRNIPVLQIHLLKGNIIKFSCITGFRYGWLICAPGVGISVRPRGDIMSMPQNQQDSLFEEYVKEAKEFLKPIHENE
jgi:hypothetical protein